MSINVPTPPVRTTLAFQQQWTEYASRLRRLIKRVPESEPEVRVSIEQQLDLADALLAQFKARSAAASSTEKTAERVYHHS